MAGEGERGAMSLLLVCCVGAVWLTVCFAALALCRTAAAGDQGGQPITEASGAEPPAPSPLPIP